MRPALQAVVDALLAESADTNTVTLDRIGEALGVEVAGSDDVEEVFAALERAGRRVLSPAKLDLQARLQEALAAARRLEAETGKKPGVADLARALGWTEGEVRHALQLGTIMGR